MSILIKGMEMPQEGNWKTVRIYPDGTCAIPNWQGDCTLLKGAQAVEIPPHGDLIDAQEQMRLLQSCDYDTYDDYNRAFDMLDNAPTIISASEEGE